MGLCQKCDPAGHIHGLEIQFLEKTRADLVVDASGYAKRISEMLNGEKPLNRHTVDLLKDCLDGISAIDNILIVIK